MANNRKLGRPTDHRKAMLRALVTYLLENGKVETTLARAKEVGPMTEKMITLGKKNTLASRRQAMAYVTKEAVVAKLFSEIAPEYANRNGGYTRIVKIGPRRLKRPEHFEAFMGQTVEVGLYKALNGAKQIEGTLAGYDDGAVTLDVGGERIVFEPKDIAAVRLAVEI